MTSTAHVHAPLRPERHVPATRSQCAPFLSNSHHVTLISPITELVFHTDQNDAKENVHACV